MKLKKSPFYASLVLLVALILCAGCEAFSPFEDQQPFRPRNVDQTQSRDFGDVVLTDGIDRDSCAVGSKTAFDDSDQVYVVLQDSAIPNGTTFFARLYKDNRAIEDTRELVAEQDYSNVCVSFVFEPTLEAEVWDTGDYKIEFYIDGNVHDAVEFVIR
jgi:hypothetical protein